MLESLLDELEVALQHGQWVLALTGALTIPDICGALRSEDGEAKRSRYKAWFEERVTPQYPTLAADDCYKLRCGVLHQGRGLTGSYEALIFLPPVSIRTRASTIGGRLLVDIEFFVRDMIAGARAWLRDSAGDVTVQRNRERLLRWHPNGLPPYIVGSPVLA